STAIRSSRSPCPRPECPSIRRLRARRSSCSRRGARRPRRSRGRGGTQAARPRRCLGGRLGTNGLPQHPAEAPDPAPGMAQKSCPLLLEVLKRASTRGRLLASFRLGYTGPYTTMPSRRGGGGAGKCPRRYAMRDVRKLGGIAALVEAVFFLLVPVLFLLVL